MGAGNAIDKLVMQALESREVAEKIMQITGADRNLAAVRRGKFAADGVIDQNALPMGTGVNLLPAFAAEFEGYAVGDVLNTSVATEDGTIITQQGHKRLKTSADDTVNGVVTTHDPYIAPETGTRYRQYGPDGQTYIYSAHAYKVLSQGNLNYVGLKITAADDINGTNPVVLYDVSNDTTNMLNVAGTEGQYVRVYAKFAVPAGKPFLRFQYKVLHSAAKYVAWGNNMLEVVSDARSFPSKYVAPTPGTGELSVDQLAFDANPNIFPYRYASLALGKGQTSTVTVNGIEQGSFGTVLEKPGFVFIPGVTGGTFWAPAASAFPDGYTRNMGVGQNYIVSAYVENIGNAPIDVTMRVGVADNPFDLVAKSGSWTVKKTGTPTTVAVGERKRVYLKYIHQATSGTPQVGPRVEFRATRADNANFAFHYEVDSLQMEAVSPATTQPSVFKPPLAGYSTIDYDQLKINNKEIMYTRINTPPSAAITRTATQTITNGAETQIAFGATDHIFSWSGFNVSPPTIQIETSGLYLLSLLFAVNLDLASITRMSGIIRVSAGPTDYRIATIMNGAMAGTPAAEGSVVLPLNAGNIISGRMSNSSASGPRDITTARLSVTWLGAT